MFSVDLSTRQCDGHVVVELRGALDLADAAGVAAALAAVAAREPDIIVDLAALEFIDSSGVAALARGRRQARHAGGDLLLAAPRQQVTRVLAITRLIDDFSVHASVEEAARQRRTLPAGGRASAAVRQDALAAYRPPQRQPPTRRHPMTAIAEPAAATVTGPGRPRPRPGRQIFRTAGPAVLVAAIFGFALPHFASYGSVWASMGAMTWAQALLVTAAAAASMVSAWIMICSVLPSIRLREAAVVNLGSNAVANTLPAGGALAMGVSWAMLSSWGISTAEYVLYTLVSGIWNVFARLGLPALGLLVLATASRPGPA